MATAPEELGPLAAGGARSAATTRAVYDRIAADADKEDPTVVNYRPATGAQNCGNCIHFQPAPAAASGAGTCELVAGSIMPTMVSDLYEGSAPPEATIPGAVPPVGPPMIPGV